MCLMQFFIHCILSYTSFHRERPIAPAFPSFPVLYRYIQTAMAQMIKYPRILSTSGTCENRIKPRTAEKIT